MRQSFQATKKTKRLSNLNRLPQAIYPMRILGMLMAGIAIVFVLIELKADIWSWSWVFFSCLIWPHLAILLTRI
ncbi:MAG: hypothetical protein OQK49_08555, partial [Proteobacteria bacterium]|nr:hypothetical protein [Pseudomonadota bacterium]